jgi:hypothetical protein
VLLVLLSGNLNLACVAASGSIKVSGHWEGLARPEMPEFVTDHSQLV